MFVVRNNQTYIKFKLFNFLFFALKGLHKLYSIFIIVKVDTHADNIIRNLPLFI